VPGRTVFSRILESLNAFSAEDNDVVLSHYHFACVLLSSFVRSSGRS